MTNQTAAELVDFKLLDEASRKLLGYYVHRKFNIHLSSILAALNRQYQDGMSEGLTRPTPSATARPTPRVCWRPFAPPRPRPTGSALRSMPAMGWTTRPPSPSPPSRS